MDGILYKDLMESYKQVHTPQELNEDYQDLHERPGGEQTKSDRQKEIDRKAKAGAKDTGLTARVGQAIGNFLNPPPSKSADPVVRKGGKYTGPGGAPEFPDDKPNKGKPQFKGPGGDPSGSGKGQAQQRSGSTPTPTPKPTPTPSSGSGGSSRPAPAPKPTPKPAPKPTPKPQSKDMGANMRAWAKANPNLAKKVKPGQSGYKAINPNADKPSGFGSSSSKPSTPSKVSGIKSNRLASALSGVKKFKAEEFDTFDLIHEYLLESGFAYDEATQIMVEMGQAKIDEILNTISEEDYDRMKDRRMERGGSGDRRERPMSDGRGKKKGSGDAFDHVVSAMKKQYGDKAIMARKSRKES